MIKPIDAWSIDQITSGQVVTSLASAVKELLENSLDAGATVVEIRLTNYGRDGVRVQDNGCGVDSADFEFLATKHATSKLEQFDDLGQVKTLGFRGEALASLCALANVTILTSSGSGYGYELELGINGKVTSQKKTTMPRGTTVQIENLFHSLPVRRKDFERNAVREYSKAVSIVQEYAILFPARITLEHVAKNRSNCVLRSQGAQLLQRIACVYGPKRVKSLCEFDFSLPQCQVRGQISKPIFGMGDSATICQLIAVNGRPSLQKLIQRAVVEVFKQYNLTETPFFVLDISIDSNLYDVNVSPDKRELFLHSHAAIIQGIRDAFDEMFKQMDHSIPRSYESRMTRPNSIISFAAYNGSGPEIQQHRKTRELSKHKEEDVVEKDTVEEGVSEKDQVEKYDVLEDEVAEEDEIAEDDEEAVEEDVSEDENQDGTAHADDNAVDDNAIDEPVMDELENIEVDGDKEDELEHLKEEAELDEEDADEVPAKRPRLSETVVNSPHSTRDLRRTKTLNTHIHLPLTIYKISEAMAQSSNGDSLKRLQNLAIDEEDVEERLQLSITKEDFRKMEIVGQFNLGFILVISRKSGHDDLFVIDQHASDEIYNFERLQKSTVLSRQPLVVPHQLELSAVEELMILEHMSVFENNGFTIGIRENQELGHRCYLESVPFSKSTIFDDRDVLELLSKIKEDPQNKQLRCSKLRAMFAMRACRSSVMVGRPLDMPTMRKIVDHLGTLDKPWNCPHGRPTLRHITSLS